MTCSSTAKPETPSLKDDTRHHARCLEPALGQRGQRQAAKTQGYLREYHSGKEEATEHRRSYCVLFPMRPGTLTCTQVYFEAEPPEGYTFIPAGNPKFTSACKDICRNRGLTVYSVTVSHADSRPTRLSTDRGRQRLTKNCMVFRNKYIALGIIFPVPLSPQSAWICMSTLTTQEESCQSVNSAICGPA